MVQYLYGSFILRTFVFKIIENTKVMKKTFISVLALALATALSAQDNPLWMRYSAISPDGSTIAFSYQGDLFTVPVVGGSAKQLTTNAAYDAQPVWSPDGQQIAFASGREGSLDVYLVGKEGGVPQRLTTHSGSEVPLGFLNNETVLLQCNILPTAQSAYFSQRMPQVYQVSTKGGRMRLFTSVTMDNLSVNPDGRILYHDRKGLEDTWRKHQTSSVVRDVWLKSTDDHFTKLTDTKCENRNPVWAANGQSFYYLSEASGTMNVYKKNIDGTGLQQLTQLKDHPVRFLSVSQNGVLCFGYNGEIYTMREGAQPQKVRISIVKDSNDREVVKQVQRSGATEIAVSPEGKEVAFVLHGDVYVTSVEYNTTKQITDTPEQERSIDFSPDGRSLVYAAERDGFWQIYQSSIVKKEDKLFTYASEIKEEKLTNTKVTSFLPKYSPDGKEVAFLENRTTLRVLNLASKQVRTVMDGKFEYSYSDGDQWFQWSPDSKWLLSNYIGYGGWNNKDVALIKADGTEIHNVTESGYNDVNAKWVLGGKAIIFGSDRAGYRSHGSWGAEDDIYIMFFDLDAYEKFRMTKEETALFDEAEKEQQKAKDEAEKKAAEAKKGKTATPEKKEVEPLVFDLENCRDRIIRLTVNSSNLGDALLTPKGDKLYYTARFEGSPDLWMHDLKDGSTSIVLKGVGGGELLTDKDFKHVYLASGSGIKQIDVDKKSTKNISFEATFNYKAGEERDYIFSHVWQQVKDKFYLPDLHGVDWEALKQNYSRFLPYITNNYDYAEMMSELLGELNASHTGMRYYAPSGRQATANLGVFIDDTYQGDGLKVAEVIAKGPFAVKKTDVKAGSIIEKIDGTTITKDMDYYPLLEGKAGKQVRVSVLNPDGKRFEVVVKAISTGERTDLLYDRWVERNKKKVEELSGGKVAYVHVKAMDSPSFRTVYRDLLSDQNRQKQAAVVDERHNGGGWLHDDLCTLLAGEQYQSFMPRGQYIGYDPYNKWVKPSCVLMCEDDYSNGHGFPWVYKTLGIGKLVGAPVAGTMTAVWWEYVIDQTLMFGIPQVGCMDMQGRYQENLQLEPDIKVYNTPEEMLRGEDKQLEAAVAEMLRQTASSN